MAWAFCRVSFQLAKASSARPRFDDGQTLTAHLKEDPRPSFSFILDVVDQTALALDAAMRGNLTMVQLLLDHGADARRVDSQGKSALAYAQEEGNTDIAILLRR